MALDFGENHRRREAGGYRIEIGLNASADRDACEAMCGSVEIRDTYDTYWELSSPPPPPTMFLSMYLGGG